MEVHGCQVRKIIYLTADFDSRQIKIFFTLGTNGLAYLSIISMSLKERYMYVLEDDFKSSNKRLIVNFGGAFCNNFCIMCDRQNYADSKGHF